MGYGKWKMKRFPATVPLPHVPLKKSVPLRCPGKMLSDCLLRLRPHKTVDELAFLEDQQRGNTPNVETAGRRGIVINIEFANDIPSARFRGELLENRCNHATGPTPLSPTIQQQRTFACIVQSSLKVCVGNHDWLVRSALINDLAQIQRRTAFAAFRLALF